MQHMKDMEVCKLSDVFLNLSYLELEFLASNQINRVVSSE